MLQRITASWARCQYAICGFRILVVLCGFYGNARHKACESNEADCYQMIAAPPLMHRKGHAGSGDQQRHQDDHFPAERDKENVSALTF